MEAADGKTTPEQIIGDLKPWGEVTNPREHNPQKFRYLVHAINPFASSTIPMMAAQVQMDRASDINKEDGNQSINMLQQPERLDERVALSCSLIDEEHHGTWGQAGLIVEAPQETVVITQSSDAGALIMSKKLLEEQASRNHLLTAEQLLKQTSQTSYNEVVAIANKDGKKVKLAGFFYKVTAGGEAMNADLAQQMKMHAEKLNLPLVAISEPNPFVKNNVVNTEQSMYAHFDGKLYTLRVADKYKFNLVEQTGHSSFMTPDDLDGLLNFLETQGISNAEVKQLKETYTKADEERQRPKIEFDEQGEVNNIEKRTGYGTSERVMRISKLGHTSWANVMEENRRFAEMMTDSTGFFGIVEPKPVLSPREVESIVHELLADGSGVEQEKIRIWYQSIKDNVSQNWQRNHERSGNNSIPSLSFDSFIPTKLKTDFGSETLLKGFSEKMFGMRPPQKDSDTSGTDK